MILTETYSIVATLGETPTTALTVIGDYMEQGETVAAVFVSSLSDTTATTILAAPATGVVYDIREVAIHNGDDVAHTLSVAFSDGTTSYGVVEVSIDVDETLLYLKNTGWCIQSGSSSGSTTTTTVTLTGDVTGSGTGTVATTLSDTDVTAGSYTLASITVGSDGRLTAASSGSVDLSDYVTSDTLTTTLADYVLTDTLSSYVTSDTLTTTLADYVTSDTLTTTLGDYVLTATLSSYVTSDTLSTTLGDYVTSDTLSTTLGDYVTSDTLTTTLASYSVTSDVFVLSSDNTITGDNEFQGPTSLTGGASIGGYSVSLGGALTTGGAVTFSGAYAATFDVPGAYTYTLPAVTGTLAALKLAQTFTADQTIDGDLSVTGSASVGSLSALTDLNTFGGYILCGYDSIVVGTKNARIQSVSSGTDSGNSPYNVISFAGWMFNAGSSDTRGAQIDLGRSGSNTRGTYVAVTSGMQLGGINFNACDGTDIRSTGAGIYSYAAAAASSDAITANLCLATASAAAAATIRWQVSADGHLIPYAASAYNIGNASYPVKNGWIQSAWTVTSDPNYKTVSYYVKNNAAALKFGYALAALPAVWQLNDAIAAKGADKARYHIGPLADEVAALAETYGFDPDTLGLYCYDERYSTVTTRSFPALSEDGAVTYDSDGNIVYETTSTAVDVAAADVTDDTDMVTATTDGVVTTTDVNSNPVYTLTTTTSETINEVSVTITVTKVTTHVTKRSLRAEEILYLVHAAVHTVQEAILAKLSLSSDDIFDAVTTTTTDDTDSASS